MSDIYKRLDDAKKLVSRDDKDYDIKANTHVLKFDTESASKKHPAILRLYTDGSSLVSSKEHQKKEQTFSGWGYSIIGFKNGTYKSIDKSNGWIFNGNPLLAELEAIKKGLEFVNRPSFLSVVCDSTDAIKELLNLDSVGSRLAKMKKSAPKNPRENVQLRMLQTLAGINKSLQSKNVSGFEITWHPSHTMEKADVSIEDLRDEMASEEDIEKKMFLLDVYGNGMADRQAGRGSKKAVKMFMEEIKRQETRLEKSGMMQVSADFLDHDVDVNINKIIREYGKAEFNNLMNYTKGLRQSSRLFSGSRAAKNLAIEFFGDQPKDYLSDQMKEILFSESDQKKIADIIERKNPEILEEKPKATLKEVAEKVGRSQGSEQNCLFSNLTPEDWARGKVTIHAQKEYEKGSLIRLP